MIKHNLRVGDMLIVLDNEMDIKNTVLLTKKTRSYWYYYCNGALARLNKRKIWELIDTSKIKVKHGSSMSKRKIQRKLRTLDLHGVHHSKVDDKVRQFLNWAQPPVNIITGDSNTMRKIVESVVKEYGWSIMSDPKNYGRLIVMEGLN